MMKILLNYRAIENPDLNRMINSFAFTQKKFDKICKDVADGIDFFRELTNLFDDYQEFINYYVNKKQENKIKKEASKCQTIIGVMLSLSGDRLKFIAKKYSLNFNDDLIYYDDLDVGDYYRVGVSYDGNVDNAKKVMEGLEEITEFAYDNYLDVMKDLELSREEAVRVLNARLKKKEIEDVEFI